MSIKPLCHAQSTRGVYNTFTMYVATDLCVCACRRIQFTEIDASRMPVATE